ncbi:Uncharacterised protein [Slackia heliotrinireducens]|uniref:Uncharacterized protein n=2 Tax=Slackia TaxID=84108 RepID=C7N4P1_SLAHD|nr:hypothetical protein [Slackia heliotrinireducens]ACV21876.1 hypothetical protein Shel_08200 [Slackia heliotrinireducens DSM 20476]VEG99649.1 Uncharacterised protein [Slackia heliotrinireducens]
MELMDLLPQIDSNKRPIARQLITELEFMQSTLEKLRAEIEANGVVEEFKNGKQEFTRETPALKSYNLTVSRYSTLYKQLTDLLPDGEPEQGDEFDEFIKGA